MSSITGMLPSSVQVLRDGIEKEVAAQDLVLGDIVSDLFCGSEPIAKSALVRGRLYQVLVRLGQKIPADLRFVSVSSDFKADRSILTGESLPITGATESTDPNFLETKNIGLQGTLCVSGSATGAVIQTGDKTVL